ncbi:MAG: hypothetical protein PHF67_03230 [Candidatus Nanoarchaeia archaeon]|nr:hypothetical protein [Candidatus Nanoarchaeia archaeon]
MKYKYKKSESLAISKVIIFILVILAIGLVLFYYYQEDIWNYIKNLPGYTVSENDTEVDYSQMKPDELAKFECTKVGNIVSRPQNQYFVSINNVETNLYLYLGPTILIRFATGGFFGEIINVGSIENRIIKINQEFLDKDSQVYLKYKDFLPSVGDLKIMNGAFLLGSNLLCKKEAQIEDLKTEAKCVDSCEIHNGVCKKFGYGEVILEGVFCKDGNLCFVKKVEEKKEDTDMLLSSFSYFDANQKISQDNSVEFEVGQVQSIGFSVLYPKYKEEGKKSFCYELRSNDKIFEIGYNNNLPENGVPKFFSMVFDEHQKFIEIAVWDPTTDPVQKVLKRVEVKTKLNSDFEGLTPASNEKFREEIIYDSEREFYVADVPFRFENGLVTSTYKIDKYPKKIEIYGYYKLKNEGKNSWHALDCYTGFIGFISVGINLDKIEPTLMETLIKNKCKLKYL